MKILVTGGAGFIGSHTCIELLNAGHAVAVVDNLCNSSAESLRRVAQITGKTPSFHKADIRDRAALDAVFDAEAPIDAVIHFAALKAVGESVRIPLNYYGNNITGTLTLCECMAAHGCRDIVFSSSATVYGNPASVPIREDFPTPGATNPYGWTKLMMEQIFRDVQKSDPAWNIILLRYFNPIGAHASGLIGEDPAGIPNNLLPYVAQVAVGRLPRLSVYGNDYPTRDGTGVRDYIHVVDLAIGHLKAIGKLASKPGLAIYNLGTGKGYSVLDVVKAFEKASGRKVPYAIVPRRPGDVAECWADPSKALKELGWKAERDLSAMCEDAWRWQSQNPNGFAKG
ncbi:MAG: UDP-glucose 4-epimerase GalE [Kiritimatiellae bacterium]|nr:UDP-glucose 4-epimerase GalE [Kiritimatiellia bacterium]